MISRGGAAARRVVVTAIGTCCAKHENALAHPNHRCALVRGVMMIDWNDVEAVA